MELEKKKITKGFYLLIIIDLPRLPSTARFTGNVLLELLLILTSIAQMPSMKLMANTPE